MRPCLSHCRGMDPGPKDNLGAPSHLVLGEGKPPSPLTWVRKGHRNATILSLSGMFNFISFLPTRWTMGWREHFTISKRSYQHMSRLLAAHSCVILRVLGLGPNPTTSCFKYTDQARNVNLGANGSRKMLNSEKSL